MMNMARKKILVPLLALFLGVLAMGFSFIAYAKRVKNEDIIAQPEGYCLYPSSPSPILGIIAALFLLAEQILISAATNCFCCCGLRCSARCTYIASLFFFLCSWFIFLITFIGLIFTVILYSGFLAKSYTGNDVGDCNTFNENLFLGAGFWCIINTALGLVSYAFWVCGPDSPRFSSQGRAFDQEQGIAMGEPQTQQLPKQ